MPESEDHRLGEVHSVGSSVHRGRDDMGVDHQAPTPGLGPLAQTQPEPQSRVLGGQEGAQVLVESEDQLHLACRGNHREEGDVVKREILFRTLIYHIQDSQTVILHFM